jgi:hypothetical protein
MWRSKVMKEQTRRFTSLPYGWRCPNCSCILEHFSGLNNIPAYDYCPKCNDIAYNPETGEMIAHLVDE